MLLRLTEEPENGVGRNTGLFFKGVRGADRWSYRLISLQSLRHCNFVSHADGRGWGMCVEVE
jgi:hypothetical protein